MGVMSIFFFQAEDGIRDIGVTGVQTCALPICERTTAWVYSVGWTKHSVGAQYIRTCSILQTLLGNIDCPVAAIRLSAGTATSQVRNTALRWTTFCRDNRPFRTPCSNVTSTSTCPMPPA